MQKGRLLMDAIGSMEDQEDWAWEQILALPELQRTLEQAPAYPVTISDYLKKLQADTLARIQPERPD